MTEWLDDEESAAWIGYRRMKRRLDAVLAAELAADSGLSEPDYDVLSILTAEEPRWCSKDLMHRLKWSQSRLSHHLARMERRGLVRRVPCDLDARGTDAELTSHGREALVRAAPAHVAAVRHHFVSHLTRQDLADLTRITQKILTALPPD